ncbi:outer membrane protein assembly factor BamE [Candidatus Endolissoclinum faulkneri]|nr:outer membrane protein assembly factor BamE [Candidatus Endolissoclinum faulkneri]
MRHSICSLLISIETIQVIFTKLNNSINLSIMHMHRIVALFIGVLVVIVAACSPQIKDHGNTVDMKSLANIKLGRTEQSEVLDLLGSPSSYANFGEDQWYYISQRIKSQAFYKPKTIERRIVCINFESSGLVKSVKVLNLNDGKKITPLRDETPTAGQNITLLKQLIGNIGRFSPDE